MSCLSSHSSCCRQDQGNKRSMLNLPNSLLVLYLLHPLMLLVASKWLNFPVWGNVRVKIPYIRNVFSWCRPQRPFTVMSRYAPSSMCKSGAMHRLPQTSFSKSAVRCCISVCHMESNPPLGQDRTCSVKKLEPHAQFKGGQDRVQLYLRVMASGKLPCEVRIDVPQW